MKEEIKNEILAKMELLFLAQINPREIIAEVVQAIDRAYEAGWEDGYNDN